MQNNKIISINNLFSVYNEDQDNQFVALSNINFDFEQNKIYFIIGNSGSGKSTLVTHFNGLINTKYGNIDIFPDFNKVKKITSELIEGILSEELTKELINTNEFDNIIVFNTKALNIKNAIAIIEAATRNKVAKIKINKQLNKLLANTCSEQDLVKYDDSLFESLNNIKKSKSKLFENKCFVNVAWNKTNSKNFKNNNLKVIDKLSKIISSNQIKKLNKETKKVIKNNPIIQVGHNWNIHNTLIGTLIEEDKIKFSKNKDNEIVFFNTSRISKKIAKLLIEGYYKIKVAKIKKVNNILLLTNKVKSKSAFEITIKEEPSVEILDRLSLESINQINEPIKINKPNSIQANKLKKIKNFKPLRREIGMVFQFPEYQLFKDTIEKDIMFGPIALGIKKEEAKVRAKHYLNKLDMTDEYLSRNPFGLSGGQKRRVAIAGILAIETDVLIFDEPTAGLDPVGEHETMKMIKEIKESGKTVFVITHTMDHVLEVADEVVVLNDGEIIKHGDPYSIFLNDEIIHTTSIDTPKVIKTIKALIQKDKRFEKLIEYKPKTTQELNDAIIELVSKFKKKGDSHVSGTN